MHLPQPSSPVAQLLNHPQRVALHNEIHARPPEAARAPTAFLHIVMLADTAEREASRTHLIKLLRDHHAPLPDEHTTHLRLDLGAFRVRWELHTEFVAWTFSAPLREEGFGQGAPLSAAAVVPQAWLAALPGECLCSLNLWTLENPDITSALLARHVLQEDTLVGSAVAGGQGEVYTDFALHADGCSRMVLKVNGIGPRRLGRLVQRLMEIETYRMAALLGFPAAREAAVVLGSAERELASLADAIRTADRNAEAELLDRLTRLAGKVESQFAATHSRFSASSAYFELVDRRIADIQEKPLPGLQTIAEFMDRRLSPARSTCAWAVRRQEALSQRVSRISNLLRTRVEIEQQQSSQELLASMNRRQDLQLRLQTTVEGLSVAAITYYIAGLVSYLAQGGQTLGWPLSPEISAALAVPVVALSVWWSLRRMHRRMFHPKH